MPKQTLVCWVSNAEDIWIIEVGQLSRYRGFGIVAKIG